MFVDEKTRWIKMGHVFVQLQTISTNRKTGFAEDVSHWFTLWDLYTVNMDEVIIHCWEEEKKFIEELSPKAAFIKNEGLITIFTLNLTEENRSFLREHSVDQNGGLKWFTMFFQKDGEQRLVVSHYGSENVLYQADKEEAERFVSLFSSEVSATYDGDDID